MLLRNKQTHIRQQYTPTVSKNNHLHLSAADTKKIHEVVIKSHSHVTVRSTGVAYVVHHHALKHENTELLVLSPVA